MKKILLIVCMVLIASTAHAFEKRVFTGSSAISEEISWGANNVKVISVELTMDSASATAENLTIRQGTAGVIYNTQDMNTVKDYVLDTSRAIKSGDAMGITWANSNSRTYVLEVYYENH